LRNINKKTGGFREESAEREVSRVIDVYSSIVDLINKSEKGMINALKLFSVVNALTSSGELSRHRLSSRLEISKSMRILSIISSDLSKKIKAIDGIEIDDSETNEKVLSSFLQKIDKAISLLSEAESEAPHISGKKTSNKIRILSNSVTEASLILKKLSKRLSSKVKITSEIVSDSIRFSGSEFE